MDVVLELVSGVMAIVAVVYLVMILRLTPGERDALKARPAEDRPLIVLMGGFAAASVAVGAVFLYSVIVRSLSAQPLQLVSEACLLGFSLVAIWRITRVRSRRSEVRAGPA